MGSMGNFQGHGEPGVPSGSRLCIEEPLDLAVGEVLARDEGADRYRPGWAAFPRWRPYLLAATLSLCSSVACLLLLWAFLPSGVTLSSRLMSWDAIWYQQIALHGYTWDAASSSGNTVGFSPLYPLIERAWTELTGFPINGFAIVSNIVLQAGAAGLLLRVLRGYRVAERAALAWVALYVVSPPVVFDLMGYYDSLFCLLIFAFLLLIQKREYWWAAGVVALMTGLVALGIAFVFGLFTWRIIDLRARRAVTLQSLTTVGAQSIVSAGGAILYSAYLQVRYGDALLYYTSFSKWEKPLPLERIFVDIATFSPVRDSIGNWAAYPFTAAASYMIDAVSVLAVFALLLALTSWRDGLRSVGFWVLLGSFLLTQVQAARYGAELSTTRLILPVAFAAGTVPVISRRLTRPLVFTGLLLVLAAVTVIYLQRLAAGQWVD